MTETPFDSDLARRLKDVVGAPFLDDLVDQVATSAGLTPTEVDRVFRYTRVKVEGIQSLADTLDSLDDIEELHDSLVTMWIELRSEWARCNKITNYRRVIHGEEDRLTSALGATCSILLRAIEPLIPNEIHRLTTFAAAPMPSISRSGRFADATIEERKVTSQSLQPVVTELSELVALMRSTPNTALASQWQQALQSCCHQFERLIWQPSVPTEVAKAAVEERLLRFAERSNLPLAPHVSIAGTERLKADTVARVMESIEKLFESLHGLLVSRDGPIRSRAEFHVNTDTVDARVSVLPSFVVDVRTQQPVLEELVANGMTYTYDDNSGLALSYQLAHSA
ncbi:MAG: hypothetical protein AAF449_01495 [Myxococcota bacterium]